MIDLTTAWRPFEPSAENVEKARCESDENRCAVCGWQMPTPKQGIASPCWRGFCGMRPRPQRLFAPERAEREAREAKEQHERALRNGMPPSGRWA